MAALKLDKNELSLLRPCSEEELRQLNAEIHTHSVLKHLSVRQQAGLSQKLALFLLGLIILLCVAAPLICTHDPTKFYLSHLNESPGQEFWLGTDSLGRDLFSLLCYGGRSSLLIGTIGALCSCSLGLIIGIGSALFPRYVGVFLQRLIEICQSVPSLLWMLTIAAFIPRRDELTLALIIGCCSWFSLARLARAETLQLQGASFLEAAASFNSSVFLKIRLHLWPRLVSVLNFAPAAAFNQALLAEAVLSFLGLGLPLEQLSWGCVLSLSGRALQHNAWWVIVFPGIILLVTMLTMTLLCASWRIEHKRRCSNL